VDCDTFIVLEATKFIYVTAMRYKANDRVINVVLVLFLAWFAR